MGCGRAKSHAPISMRRVEEAHRPCVSTDLADDPCAVCRAANSSASRSRAPWSIEPDILLMDEPLGALDRQLRKDVQIEIRRMHVARPRTTLYVTHDQEEALVMSDRIAVLRQGRIVQLGTAQDLYARPVDSFVARFLGESNLVSGRVAAVQGGCARLDVAGFGGPIEGRSAEGLRVSETACALIRPEHVRPTARGLPARVLERLFLGEIVALRLGLPGGVELWSRLFSADAPEGETIEIGWEKDRVSILPEAL